MKELAVEYKDSVVFYKVNVDQERELAALFGATSIPLFVFIPVEGEPVLMKGAADKDTYVRAINEILMTSGK
jgi:thioredoxin-like negative regulator of GroEL